MGAKLVQIERNTKGKLVFLLYQGCQSPVPVAFFFLNNAYRRHLTVSLLVYNKREAAGGYASHSYLVEMNVNTRYFFVF